MKKKLFALLMAASMVLSLAACGGKDPEPAKDDTPAQADTQQEEAQAPAEDENAQEAAPEEGTGEEITLRMAWWGSQTRHDLTVEVIEMYEKEHPGVKIEYEFFSFDDYFTKLKTLVASDQVWDIFQLGGNFPMYMDKIYPLDEYIESGVVDVAKISDAYLKITQDFDGTQLGLSNGLNTYGIAYDVDMFNDAGVALPDETWTWDDYAAAARAIHEKTGHFGTSGFASSEFIAGCSTYIGQLGQVGQYSFFNIDLTGMGFEDASMLTPYIQMRADLI